MTINNHPLQFKNPYIYIYIYNLNKLQVATFESFTQINSIKQILQYVGGVTRIGKIQIIKAIQDFFMKTKNE
jgi:hypothetical protein